MNKLFKGSAYRKIGNLFFPHKKLTDEFYDTLYLTCSSAPIFIPENLYCLDYAIRNLPTGDPVLEIGSFLGMSTNLIIHFLKKYNRSNSLFTCDKWEFEEKEKNYYQRVLGIPPDEFRNFIRDSFIRNLKFFNGDRLPFTIELFSDEFFGEWKSKVEVTDVFRRKTSAGGLLSFVYVDGNHQYEFVKRDFEHADDFLVKGGFIFFDDSAPDIETGMRDLVKEVKKRKDYEVVMKNPNYLFMKK